MHALRTLKITLTFTIMKYVCSVCGYEYDEAVEGTPFNELPEDWTCPLCSVGKDEFEAAE